MAPARARLKPQSFLVAESALHRAKKAWGASTDARVVRVSVERIAEMEAFWNFLKQSRRFLKPGSLRRP